MSQYTDYDAVCENYDKGRVAFGADKLLDEITRVTEKLPEHLHILDAGCGTGNYSQAMLKLGVGKLSLLDASNGMLKQAEKKLRSYTESGRICEVKHGILPEIPFDREQFDAIMFNCVLHHLEKDLPETENDPFPNILKAFIEVHRVLKPGGLLTAIVQYPEQYQGQWFVNLAPSALQKYLLRLLRYEQFVSMAMKAGFSKPEEVRILGSDWFASYNDPDGPLLKTWRDGDSYWSYLSTDELEEALQKVKTMKADGRLENFVREHDGSMTRGHFTILVAKKI